MSKRLAWFTSLALAVAVVATALPAAAAEPGQHAHRGLAKLQERLGLSDEQVTGLQTIHANQAEARRELRGQLREARRAVRELALAGGDETALREKMTELAGLQARAVELHVERLQEVAAILTPEQREKLAELRPGKRGYRHHRTSQPQRS
jgi:Spy/CpxP family protein refolding chaperone